MEAVTLLQNTKERLFTYGWQQNKWGTIGGPNCLVGAIAHSCPVDELASPVFDDVTDAIREVLGRDSIIVWNDDPKITFLDVINVIDRAIAGIQGILRAFEPDNK